MLQVKYHKKTPISFSIQIIICPNQTQICHFLKKKRSSCKNKQTFDCTLKNRKTDLLSWVMIIYPANKIKIMVECTQFLAQLSSQKFFISALQVRIFICMFVISAVFYLSSGLAGCSVDPRISCDARKLVRTPRVIKKLWLNDKI